MNYDNSNNTIITIINDFGEYSLGYLIEGLCQIDGESRDTILEKYKGLTIFEDGTEEYRNNTLNIILNKKIPE